MRETAAAILNMPMKKGAVYDIDKARNVESVKGKNVTVQDAIVMKQAEKAMKGDTRSAEFIHELVEPTKGILGDVSDKEISIIIKPLEKKDADRD